MIPVDEIIEYCMQKHKAYVDYPFGEIPMCFKLEKKVFAQIYPRPEDYKITLKCDPLRSTFYREMYPGIVVRGYHCPPIQQPHWNTINLNEISKEVLFEMIDHAYQRVLESFSKKKQREIQEMDV